MSLDPGPSLSAEHAAELLAELASALHTDAASRQQLVLPAGERHDDGSRVAVAGEAVLILDERGVIVGFNEAAERLFGGPGIAGLAASALFTTGDDAEPAIAFVEEAGRRRLVLSPRLRGRHPGGARLELGHGELVLDGRRRYLLLIRDRDHERPGDRSLRSAHARYQALVEQIPAVTFMAALDDGENEIYVSPQIEALLGYSQKEWLDDPVLWFSRLHPDDRELWNHELARGIATGGPFRAECRVIARDGRVVWIHGEARLVRDDSGRPLFLQGIAFDISESKRAEEELRQALELKARSERLSAIGQLAASIGHDLRNPLAAIRNAHYYVSRRLASNPLGSDARITQMLKVIDNELAASSKIISDLLDFARERRPNHVACPLAPLVADAMSIVPTPPHVQLVNEVDDAVPVLDLDRDQMRQVLVNLLQNAAESIPDGRPGRVTVAAVALPDEVVLTIRDNGEGIPEENLSRILEPLFTTKARGTGLGLAIVNSIVQRHGGRLEVASERHVGTTFTVRLPRHLQPGSGA